MGDDTNEMDLSERALGAMKWIDLVQDRYHRTPS